MLIEVRCDKFREKVVTFHKGLNVVLGDSAASNSIGKSSLLMVLDFIFGGNTFLEHNKDTVEELGHHSYFFCFSFEGEEHKFRRGTYEPKLVHECDGDYNEVKAIDINDYTGFLKSKYNLVSIDLTFRGVVSLFSRIWGKENIDVNRPLHSFKNQKSSECIVNTLKQFEVYEPIKLVEERVKEKREEKSLIRKSFSKGIIPKVTQREYKNRIGQIGKISAEINDIKNNLAKYAINISEITNREVLELKEQKDELLSQNLYFETRLKRVRKDLESNRNVKSRSLNKLVEYFPNVNQERIQEVEGFHSKISEILRGELKKNEKEILGNLEVLEEGIASIDRKINRLLSNLENPNAIIDRVYELSNEHSKASLEVKYYESYEGVQNELKKAESELESEKERLLGFVESLINNQTASYVHEIYGEQRQSPILKLRKNSYSYQAMEDTGTGKAYSSLILLDLSFLNSTKLPFVIHDSVLYKNIQNDAVAKLVDLYMSGEKQKFIAIDEIEKYGEYAERVLDQQSVIKLNNESLLYVKDWRQ